MTRVVAKIRDRAQISRVGQRIERCDAPIGVLGLGIIEKPPRQMRPDESARSCNQYMHEISACIASCLRGCARQREFNAGIARLRTRARAGARAHQAADTMIFPRSSRQSSNVPRAAPPVGLASAGDPVFINGRRRGRGTERRQYLYFRKELTVRTPGIPGNRKRRPAIVKHAKTCLSGPQCLKHIFR